MTTGRSLLGVMRSLHIYLSGLAMAMSLFIAVTGFLLNHSSRFGFDDPESRTATFTLPVTEVSQMNKRAIERELRQALGSPGRLNSFEVEPEEIRITFKKPGSRIDAVVDRATGETQVTTEDRGKIGILTDLHKGASAGRVWSLVIDAAAILLVLVSLTGLVLLLSLPRRRWLSISVTIIGVAAVIVIYAFFVA